MCLYHQRVLLQRWVVFASLYSIIWHLLNGSDALKVTVIELVESKGILYSPVSDTSHFHANKTLESFLAPKPSWCRKCSSGKCISHSITLSCKVTSSSSKISPDGDSFSWASLVAVTSLGDNLPTIKMAHQILDILFIQIHVTSLYAHLSTIHMHIMLMINYIQKSFLSVTASG